MRFLKSVPVLAVLQVAAFSQSTTLNLSQDLVRLGIASANMVPNQPTQDAGPLLTTGVSYATSHQIATVIADAGAYYFLSLQYGNFHAVLSEANNITVDLQGSDLYFSHPLKFGLYLSDCTNTVLRNFTLDYQPLPFTQVEVASVDPASAQIQFSVPSGWQDPSALNAVFTGAQSPTGAGNEVEVHIFRDGQPAPGVLRMSSMLPISGSSITIAPDPSGVALTPVLSTIRPGDIAVLAMRYAGGGPLLVNNCSGCTLRNITAYSSPEDGVSVIYSQSTVLERVNTIPKPDTDRLVSTFGQGFNPSGPNNLITLSRAVRTMDDGFSFYLWITGIVASQPSSNSLVVEGAPVTNLSQGVSIANGSAVTFERTSDGAMLGSAMVVSQSAPTSTQPYQVTYTFDGNLPANLVGAAMYSSGPDQRGADTSMVRNAVQDQADCCRGISIWGLANSTLSGNYVRRSAMAGVGIQHNLYMGDWQVPPLMSLSVSNNVIDGTNVAFTDNPILQLGGIEAITQHPTMHR